MKYEKRLVVDFDDTLFFTKNRDWENAEPNLELIEKINGLYEEGWRVDIFTARGSISCDSREQAKEKYLNGMLRLLEKYNVMYHEISFEKPLAAYYIDDKSITPEEFIKKDFKQLQGGLSGSDIYTDGEQVHKTDDNSHNVVEWYNATNNILNTPEIHRVVGNTVSMEYIEHNESFFESNVYFALALIQESLDSMRKLKPINNLRFSDYKKRILTNHLKPALENDSLSKQQKKVLLITYENLSLIDVNPSFSHGDFGIKNMLFTEGKKLYLIDPIPQTFGSLEIDVAKFIASMYINEYNEQLINTSLKTLCTFNGLELSLINKLISSELMRVVKYHPDPEKIVELISNVY